MSCSCCGGKGSKEPMGWDGWLFVASLIGLLVCRVVAEFSDFDRLAVTMAWICGGLLVVAVLACWFRPRQNSSKCDHPDHPD